MSYEYEIYRNGIDNQQEYTNTHKSGVIPLRSIGITKTFVVAKLASKANSYNLHYVK